MKEILTKALDDIGEKGCDRVITDHSGGSVPYKNAIEEFGIEIDFIFVDEQGELIGCHRNMLSSTAHLRTWLAVLIRPLDTLMPFEKFIKLTSSDIDAILVPMAGIHPKIPQPKSHNRYNRRR